MWRCDPAEDATDSSVFVAMIVRDLAVMEVLILLTVVVTVGQLVMCVLVAVPERSVVPLAHAEYATRMVMGHMIMIMGVALGRMRMHQLLAFAFNVLRCHATTSLVGNVAGPQSGGAVLARRLCRRAAAWCVAG